VGTPDTDRDRGVEQLLRRSLRDGAATSRPELCLDAETLAAWVERDLTAAESAVAEAHVSQCSRCQATVAALVRATPAIETHAPWWRRGWVVGSLVPLTAGAIAIAVWIAAPDEARRAPADRQEAQRPLPAATPAPTPSATVQPQPPPALADRAAARASEARSEAPRRLREAKEEADKSARRDQATAAPAAPPPAATDALRAQVSTAREARTLSKQAFAAREIASPDPSVRWRLGPSGSIEHSTNGGATWEALSSGASEDLTGGSAPSPTIVWVVGRNGTVLLSTDGRRWQRVAFPDRADLVAVRADDALNATVTTADGRTFRTSDSGRTWTPLQEF